MTWRFQVKDPQDFWFGNTAGTEQNHPTSGQNQAHISTHDFQYGHYPKPPFLPSQPHFRAPSPAYPVRYAQQYPTLVLDHDQALQNHANAPGPLGYGETTIKQEPSQNLDDNILFAPHSQYELNMEVPVEKKEVQYAKTRTKKRKSAPEQPTDEKEPAKPSKKRVAKACNKCHIDHHICNVDPYLGGYHGCDRCKAYRVECVLDPEPSRRGPKEEFKKVTMMAKIEELEKEIDARDSYVQQLEKDIEERDDYVQQLEKEMEDRDNHIQQLLSLNKLLHLNKDLKNVNEEKSAHPDAEGRKQEQT